MREWMSGLEVLAAKALNLDQADRGAEAPLFHGIPDDVQVSRTPFIYYLSVAPIRNFK